MKKRISQLIAVILVAVVFTFFQSSFSRQNLQAKEADSGSTEKNKKQKSELPYLGEGEDTSDRGASLKTYESVINLTDTTETMLPSEYSFMPRWTAKTEAIATGFTKETVAGDGFTGDTYVYSAEDANQNKPATLTYTNVGLFKGKWIDLRISLLGMVGEFGRGAKGLFIGGSSKDFNKIRLGKSKSNKENEFPRVELLYEYFEHSTNTKIEVTGYNAFSDVDFKESILLDIVQMKLQKFLVFEDTRLNYKKSDGLVHIMPADPSAGNVPEDEASRESAKRSWAAYTFGPTSGYKIILRMSASTTMSDSEALLPFETDNPSKVGDSNENTDGKNNVNYSIYQYTPNNGKSYRYKSFIWTDAVHNAVKIDKPENIELKLNQTQELLPKDYYKVTINRNVDVPAVAEDLENGVKAEEAGIRDVIRVEFTEKFMNDPKMYGEMLQMDINATLNQADRLALQSTYKDGAFVIPNRSELRYTDSISLASGVNQEKKVSSNTAFAKIKSKEPVQTSASKKVFNKTAADANRQPTDKAKVGDILNYEIEVKNLSTVPANIWKDVEISDPIVEFLDIEPSTITITKNDTVENHPEYYNKDSRKLILPKQNIDAKSTADLKINFSATINMSASNQYIDNWVYAKGSDSSGKPVNNEAKATLKEQVENNEPPTITLDVETGESTGEAKELTGTFRDKDSESVTMWYKVDNGKAISVTPSLKNNPKDNDNPYKFTIKAEELPYGPHIVTVYAIDSEDLISNEKKLTLDGILQLASSPKTLNFGTLTYDATDQKVENPTYTEPLVVIDSRANRTNGWTLSATLTKPMTNAKGQELVNALQYVNKGKEDTLGKAALTIYTNKEGKDGKYVVSDTWGKTEGTDGIKLKIGSSDRVYTGDYTGIVTWKIMPGEP